ncbi:MAG: hypothetical protein ACFE0Q_12865 [Anaerolineae bacterium]
MKKQNIPQHILERIESELIEQEDLLWAGQPNPMRFLTKRPDRTHPILSVLIGLELVLLAGVALVGNTPLLIGVLIGLVLTAVLGGLWQQFDNADNTFYAITNKRALVIEGQRVVSFGHEDLQSIERRMHGNARGDIIFRETVVTDRVPFAYGLLPRRTTEEHGFFGVEHPEQVELLLLRTFHHPAPIDTQRLQDHSDERDTPYDDTLHDTQRGYQRS